MQELFQWLLGPLWTTLFGRSEAARQATLLRTLAIAVEKQFPIASLLDSFASDTRGRAGRRLHLFAELLSAGTSIPDALESVPGIMGYEAIGMVRIGAASGNISAALREAANLARQRSENPTSQVHDLLIYLGFVFGVVGLVTTFLMIWIVPKFKYIFEGFDESLPPLTNAVIDASYLVSQYWLVAVLAIVTLLVLWMTLPVDLQSMTASRLWNRPVQFASRFWPRWNTPSLLRCLSLAVEGGQSLFMALEVITTRHPDRLLRRDAAPLADAVNRGDDCWESLRRSGMLRSGEAGLLAAAECAGNLAWALRAMAEGLERRTAYRFQVLREALQPILIAVPGVIVGILCVSIFQPLVILIENLVKTPQ